MRLVRMLTARRRAGSILAATGPLRAIVIAGTAAGTESVLAGAPVRTVLIATAFEADQTVLLGIAADQPVTAVELRRPVPGGIHVVHWIADAIETYARWAAIAVDTCLAVRAVIGVETVLVAAFVRNAFAGAANRAVAAILIVTTVGAIALVVANA